MRDGELAIRREATEVDALVSTVVEGHAARASAEGVSIERAVEPGTAHVDPLRFRQAADNLLDNAIRHTGRGGRVRISTGFEGESLALRVEDTGPGFDPGFLERAFEPFARNGHAEASGAGLGLAIVRAIAEAHRGSATAKNAAGGGARVTARFGDAAATPRA
jgi:signal transduction histidine kinase